MNYKKTHNSGNSDGKKKSADSIENGSGKDKNSYKVKTHEIMTEESLKKSLHWS